MCEWMESTCSRVLCSVHLQMSHWTYIQVGELAQHVRCRNWFRRVQRVWIRPRGWPRGTVRIPAGASTQHCNKHTQHHACQPTVCSKPEWQITIAQLPHTTPMWLLLRGTTTLFQCLSIALAWHALSWLRVNLTSS